MRLGFRHRGSGFLVDVEHLRVQGFTVRGSDFWEVGQVVSSAGCGRINLTRCVHWMVLESQLPHKIVNA